MIRFSHQIYCSASSSRKWLREIWCFRKHYISKNSVWSEVEILYYTIYKIQKKKIYNKFQKKYSITYYYWSFNFTPRWIFTNSNFIAKNSVPPCLAICKRGVQASMEPLAYLLVTTTTLTSYLAHLRQTMAMLHVGSDASVSILLDVGGARLIRDFGGIINAYILHSKWTPY